jgi:hypothetical protein
MLRPGGALARIAGVWHRVAIRLGRGIWMPFDARHRRAAVGVMAAALLLGVMAWPGAGTVGQVHGADPTTGPVPTPDDPGGEPEAGPGTDDPWAEVFGTAEGETPPAGLSPDCLQSDDPVAVADELMADRYQLGSWPATTLPHDPTWTEDPYGDANWRFRYHSLRHLLDLIAAGVQTGDPSYSDRAIELAADWVHDNPRTGAPSDMSWNDHSTALRAVVLTCIADQLPWPDWLEDALRLHGRVLADPTFYVQRGNHALNQAVGLLEVGRVVGKQEWIDLAVTRIRDLVRESIDAEGVTNEQSVGYQYYNYRRYSVTRDRLLALGVVPDPAFDRIERMPEFLAYGTLPWGAYELLGDTIDGPATPIVGTYAEYAATLGTSGPKPPTPIRRFAAGYLFARSGWGETRAFADDTALSVRWGPKRRFHGHEDGSSITLAAWGSRLLLDPGLYAYQGGPYRDFMMSRAAHNVVTVDGSDWRRRTVTTLRSYSVSRRSVDLRLRWEGGYKGVVQTRRITWSRALDYLVVDDRVRSDEPHTYRQLWHLPRGAQPVLGADTVRTRRDRGNVLIRQLIGNVQQRIVTGRTSPIQGWVSLTYASLKKAPVAEVIQRGRDVRYVTLIVPAKGRPRAEVLAFSPTDRGYVLRVRIGNRVERVVVDGASVSITG